MLRERRRHANYKPNRRLDRKSSRGMIYENEELRLRTININAEVERGQSDIRKLRRENELLKREIWSLRDEYDRINKKMCARKNCGSCENNINNSDSQTEDSDSCDTCKEDEDLENDDQTDDQQCLEQRENQDNGDISKRLCSQAARATKLDLLPPADHTNQEIVENYENFQKALVACDAAAIASTSNSSPVSKHNCKAPPSIESVSNKLRENLHVNFGHLSVLSEENSTNSSDGASINDETGAAAVTIIGVQDQQAASNQLPTSPLREIQSVLPPLSHFENIPYDQIGHSAASLDDLNYSTSTTTTGETVVPTSGWDFNMKSSADYNSNSDHRHHEQQGPGESGSSSSSSTIQFRSPKHFFSPIKPRLQPQFRQNQTAGPPPHSPPTLRTNPPDLFVANVLASPYHRPSCSGDRTSPPLPPRPYSPNSSYQDGNLEDLLLEIESLQMQLEKHKSFSQEKLSASEILSNRKPYRSEMNLVVSCNGSKPVITPITKTTSASMTTGFVYNSNYFSTTKTTTTPTAATNSMTMDTPPPNLPNPMILFPQNLTYLNRDVYGPPCSGSVPVLTDITEYPAIVPVPAVRGPQIGGDATFPPVVASAASASSTVPKMGGDGASTTTTTTTSAAMASVAGTSGAAAVKFGSPKLQSRKSPAVMRRKLFSNRDDETPSITASSSTDGIASEKFPQATDNMATDNFQNDSSSGSDTTKRKTSRRVSIIFNSGSTPTGSIRKSEEKEKEKEKERDRRTEENTLTNKATTSDLGTSLTNNLLQKSQKSSHELVTQSTPNSPHSGTRRNSAAHSLSSHHHHHNKDQRHQHGDKSRKWSQESVKFQQAKCSRRYSEGTVDSIAALSNSSPFNSTYGGGGTASSDGAQQQQQQQGQHHHDSFHEPGTSISERNSNSFGSSRESSTSQSTHSQRRKISVSSHNGGKIPWCGCWGNGCL